MKAGKYSVKELFVNRYVQKIIIPEIQRDYVWEESQVLGLFNSIYNDYLNFINCEPPIKIEDKELENSFHEFYKKQKYSSNIGFIYAYNDEQYIGKYFLIDGQQRITTICLLLLAVVVESKNELLINKFKRTYMVDKLHKLDYKVREPAHIFFNRFIDKVLCNSEINIESESWFYKNYEGDVTINSIIRNYEVLSKKIHDEQIGNEKFYSFIENYTELWYFDTNVSEQGEELYIYMNARGEQMQSNENIKADLLSKLSSLDEKNEYGMLWEEWQDYFWQKKGKNQNADKGFNEFLSCISGLENYISNKKIVYNKEKFDKDRRINPNDILENLNLTKVKTYLELLKFLDENKHYFKADYSYSKWVDKSIELIWFFLNEESTNWYADYLDENRATERNRMVFLWPLFYYFSKASSNNSKTIDCKEIFRLLRVFYLRYYNNNRSVSNLKTKVEFLLENEVLTHLECSSEEQTEEIREELSKNNALSKFEEQKLFEVEELIWEIEDHPLNLEGRDVGRMTHISHLIDLESNYFTKEHLTLIRNKFYLLFPVPTRTRKDRSYTVQGHTIQNILLYYGEYWHRVSPTYYQNYQFDDWRRTIRGTGNLVDENIFLKFFRDFLEDEKTIKEILEIKQKEFKLKANECRTLNEKLCWYNKRLNDQMWTQGNNIAIRDWDEPDKIFTDISALTNIHRNYKGGSPKKLFQLLPEEII